MPFITSIDLKRVTITCIIHCEFECHAAILLFSMTHIADSLMALYKLVISCLLFTNLVQQTFCKVTLRNLIMVRYLTDLKCVYLLIKNDKI